MIKTLQKHGNSQALVIEKSLLDALGIDSDTHLAISVSAQSLIITPVNVGLGSKAVAAALERLRPRYGQMLRNLAE